MSLSYTPKPYVPAEPLIIYKGSTFIKQWYWLQKDESVQPPTTTPVDLTSWTAELVGRKKPGDAVTLIKLSTADGTIELGADGGIKLIIPFADTEAITWKQCVFQLELTTPDGVTKIRRIEGTLAVSPETVYPDPVTP